MPDIAAPGMQGFSKKLCYRMMYIQGEDAYGAACYQFVLFSPAGLTAYKRAGKDADAAAYGVVLYSGWGEANEYHREMAHQRLKFYTIDAADIHTAK